MSMTTLDGHLSSQDGAVWTDGENGWTVMPQRDDQGRAIVFTIWSAGSGLAYYHYPFDPESRYAEYEEECEWLEGHPCWAVEIRDA